MHIDAFPDMPRLLGLAQLECCLALGKFRTIRISQRVVHGSSSSRRCNNIDASRLRMLTWLVQTLCSSIDQVKPPAAVLACTDITMGGLSKAHQGGSQRLEDR